MPGGGLTATVDDEPESPWSTPPAVSIRKPLFRGLMPQVKGNAASSLSRSSRVTHHSPTELLHSENAFTPPGALQKRTTRGMTTLLHELSAANEQLDEEDNITPVVPARQLRSVAVPKLQSKWQQETPDQVSKNIDTFQEYEALLDHVRNLLSDGLLESAEWILLFVLHDWKGSDTFTTSNHNWQHLQVEFECLFADLLIQRHEFARAEARLKRILFELSEPDSQAAGLKQWWLPVRVRLATCYSEMKQFENVRLILERIPNPLRTVKVWRLLAGAYEVAGWYSRCIMALQAVLRLQPFAIECIPAIQRAQSLAASLVSNTMSHSLEDIFSTRNLPVLDSWLPTWMNAHEFASRHDNESSLEQWRSLPQHALVLQQMAQVHTASGHSLMASEAYAEALRLDPHLTRGVHLYAALLIEQGQLSQVNYLAQTLLKEASQSIDAWMTVALWAEASGEREKALTFLEKAVKTDGNCIQAHLLQGQIFMTMERPLEAIQSFRCAYRLQKSVSTVQPLVEAYLSQNKIREAYALAHDLIQCMPKNANALTLFGFVLLQKSGNYETKAQQYFQKALSLDPLCTEAVMALVSHYVNASDWQEAINLLDQHAQHCPSDYVHARLADVYLLSGDIENAYDQYQTALTLNPKCERALDGLSRLDEMHEQQQQAPQSDDVS